MLWGVGGVGCGGMCGGECEDFSVSARLEVLVEGERKV
eukprot:COSAG02_NODE_56580_length_285_cov_0.392473_1_plen_37_part_01